MSMLASIAVSLITAITGAVCAGVVASLAVDWYRVSSFEGKSGFMVVGIGLAGGLAGLLLGFIVSRIVAARPAPGFPKALVVALATVLLIAGAAGAVARLLADVPPRIDGEALLLAVEVRFPAGHPGPAAGGDREWALRLSATSGRTVRVSRVGPLWKEDARQEDGRWIVPGAVEVFTSRGSRLIDILPDGVSEGGFIVPLPGWPGKDQLEWSDWLPHARPGEPELPEGLRYRFKIVPRNQPVRTEPAGAFEIATVARSFSSFSSGERGEPYEADADFLLRYRGQPVSIEPGAGAPASAPDPAPGRFDRASAVAVLPGAPPSLLVFVADGYDSGHYVLLTDAGGKLLIDDVASGSRSRPAYLLTSDAAAFARARDRRPLVGRVDRRMFEEGGLYLVGSAILDVNAGTVRRFTAQAAGPVREDLLPVALSPDHRSFARLGFDRDSPETRVLHVIDTVADRAYAVPIDVARTRLASLEAVDPAWVAHYFSWEPGPDGADQLVARADAAPLPHRGLLATDRDGYREYKLFLAGQAVADALVEFLQGGFTVESVTKPEYVAGYEVTVSGRVVHVMVQEEAGVVSVWMERGTDTALVAEIARRFDEALATGRYDDAFQAKD